MEDKKISSEEDEDMDLYIIIIYRFLKKPIESRPLK